MSGGEITRGENYSDGIEFGNRKNQPFDWENKELAKTLPEVEEPIYPDIMAEIPGLVLESDFADEGDAITTPAPPTLAKRAAAALSNARLTKSTGVDEQSQEWTDQLQECTIIRVFVLYLHRWNPMLKG